MSHFVTHFGIPATELFHIAALEVTLVKLNVDIPFEDVMKVLRKEGEEARRVRFNAKCESDPI